MSENRSAENIEQQYDDVMSYLEGYRCFVENFTGWRAIRILMAYNLGLKRLPSTANPLSGKNPELVRTVVTETATEEEKSNDYYRIATSDYPLHELSISTENKFSGIDFEKINKLHELKKQRIPPLDIKRVIGILLGAATLLLKSIPESVIKRYVDYEEFELAVTTFASITIGYLSFIFLLVWYHSNRVKKTYEFATYVLEYISIRLDESK